MVLNLDHVYSVSSLIVLSIQEQHPFFTCESLSIKPLHVDIEFPWLIIDGKRRLYMRLCKKVPLFFSLLLVYLNIFTIRTYNENAEMRSYRKWSHDESSLSDALFKKKPYLGQ